MKHILTLVIIFISNNLLANIQCRTLFELTPSQQTQDNYTVDAYVTALAKLKIQIDQRLFASDQELEFAKQKFLEELAKVKSQIPQFKEDFNREYNRLKETLVAEANQRENDVKEKQKILTEIKERLNIQNLMNFHFIPEGNFDLYYTDFRRKLPTNIKNSFEMMDTDVTQLQWAYISVLLGEKDPELLSPAYFNKGKASKLTILLDTATNIQAEFPVENVSYDQVNAWIKGLNQLSKNGNQQAQERIKKVIPSHNKGDVYDLPTFEEWYYVATNLGRENEIYFYTNELKKIDPFAVYQVNSNMQTAEVKSKLPRIIQGAEFFDLQGNVSKWVRRDRFPGGHYVGGNWNDIDMRLRNGDNLMEHRTSTRSNEIGFRLVKRR
jgi:formylglycine-generating enzyme required for sulfatase activity